MLMPVAEKAAALRQQKALCPCSFASHRPAYVTSAHGSSFRINSNIVLSPSSPHSSTDSQWVPQFQLASNDSAGSRTGLLEPALSHVVDTVQAILDAMHNACTSAINCVYDWITAVVNVCLLRLGFQSAAQRQEGQTVSSPAQQQTSLPSSVSSQPHEAHAVPVSSISFSNGSYARLLQQRCVSVQQAVTGLPIYTTVSSLPVGYRISILAASLLVVLLPAGLIAHHKAQRRRREEEALRAMNASSLSRQRKRMAAALAFDAINVELPTIAGAEVDPNTLPVEAVATSLIESEPGSFTSNDSFLSLEAGMRSQWEQFAVASKVRYVRNLWDARSAAAEEAELAPRASRQQLEEMSRRIKNANKNADGSEIVDPPVSLDGEGGEDVPRSGITWGDSSSQGSGVSSINTSSSSVLGEDWEAGLAERAARRRARFAAATGGRDQPDLYPAVEPQPAIKDQLIASEQSVVVDPQPAPAHASLPPAAARAALLNKFRRVRSPSSGLPGLREQQEDQQRLQQSRPA